MLQNEAGASAVPVPASAVPASAVPAGAVPAGAVPAGAVPAGAVPASAGRAWLPALSGDDRAALGLWAAGHLALVALAWAAAWAFRPTDAHAPLTGAFEHWDAILLHNIAQYGYFGPHTVANNTAFFPGYPVALAAGHLVLRNWVLAELVVSAVAGCFAMVALARLAGGSRGDAGGGDAGGADDSGADDSGADGSGVRGSRAVLYLLTTPAAIFLMVGYAEVLFLALAIPAWRAAARGRWWSAALLAGLAGLVRPDALFLIPALAIMALTGYRGPGTWPPAAATVAGRLVNAAKACCALAGPAAYGIYLWVHTGNVLAWSAALRKGWDLHPSTPFQDLRTTWWAAFRHAFSASTAFEFQLEFGAIAVIAAATIAFACWRRWPQAAYCGLALIALGTSTWIETAPRTLLVLFPVWIGLAALEARRPWLRYAYFGVSAPLAVVLAMLFLSGQWAG